MVITLSNDGMNADHNRDQAILIQTQSPLATFLWVTKPKKKMKGAYRIRPVKL